MRSVLLYIFLVGLPVLGIVAVLRVGEGLTPPRSVAGDWRVDSPAQTFESLACRPSWWLSGQTEMVISQSGPSLVLTFPGAPEWTLSGTIQGESLTAGGQGPSPEAPDAALGNAADLELILDWQADPDRLTGVVRLSGCGAAMRFAATRQSGGSPGLH